MSYNKDNLSGLLIVLLIFAFFGMNDLIAQVGTYRLHWLPNIVQSSEKGNFTGREELLKFEGAFYNADRLPCYGASFKLQYPEKKYRITNLKYEPVPDSMIRFVKIPSSIGSPEPVLKKYLSGKNEVYLDLSLIPLRRNPESGTLERLMQFQIELQSEIDSTIYQSIQSSSMLPVNSILTTGQWYKIKVKQTGVYKLTYSDLLSMGFTNPANIRIYGNGGRQLSLWNDAPRPADLNEIPVYISKGDDQVFNEGDYLLFYAEGPVTWNFNSASDFFSQSLHGFSDAIYYFLTTSFGPADIMNTIDNRGLVSNIEVNSYNYNSYYEKELYNLIGSGRTWFSTRIDGDPFDTTFTIPGHLTNDSVKVLVRLAGRSGTLRSAYLYINDQLSDFYTFPNVPFGHSWDTYAQAGILDCNFNLSGESFDLEVTYNKSDYSDECYINNITINARSTLSITQYPFLFRDIKSVGEGNIARFNLSNVTGDIRIWDITDINHVSAIIGEQSGSTYSFKATADVLREYAVVDLDYNYPKPIIDKNERGVGEVLNQNLRGLPAYNYIIVAPDVFLEQAERLANHHRSKGELSVLLVTPELIYNEFSGGTPDATALRDFFRHQYLKGNLDGGLQYVLLFGDGSYNNHMYVEGNTNYIPTYESENSLDPQISYVSDDFFGLLDEGKSNNELAGKLDIGVGRLTVKLVNGSDFEAEDVVNKIIAYDTAKYCDWRRTLCFLSDDGYDAPNVYNGSEFMRSVETITGYIHENYPGFETRKLYLDAYPEVNNATGATYPELNLELKNMINKGILMLTYFGHGSDNHITSERVLTKQDVMSVKNKNMLPLIITGSCSVSKYDQVETENNNPYRLTPKTSMGEAALLNPDGGAIALLSTTRVVYQAENENLISAVYKYIFNDDDNENPYRLGDIVRLAKNSLPDQANKHNFSLLGDPALRIAYPRFKVLTDSINHKAITEELDTLKAFDLVEVSGFVAYDDSSVIGDFNGYVYPQVYDKPTTITTFGNDNIEPFVYQDQQTLLYKGKATVTNGRFSFSFIIPKDISYNVDSGKISYYAENGIIDAKGDFRAVNIGGTNEYAEIDLEGPEINLFMNDMRFEDGGMTNSEPYLLAHLYDLHGINTSGAGIGHDILAVLDDESDQLYVLNDYYEADVDDFRSGKVRYQLLDLDEGTHELTVKAWDVYNNSSMASIGFTVESSNGIVVEKVINFPNPANEFTQFQYTHNVPDELHKIHLEVFDISGNRVASIEKSQYETGFVSAPVGWDLKGSGGSILSPGVYPYRITVSTPAGTGHINQRLIIIR